MSHVHNEFIKVTILIVKDTNNLSIDIFNDLENPPPEVVSTAIHLKGIQTQSD